ncbi:MAG: HD domain-containing protein [Proteobacteria bacterium]|jgi:(p)ppGpp synthase/HD superfamily hydrolase|nr:HD domain-containing protein [Pseudomonadota bacterium]
MDLVQRAQDFAAERHGFQQYGKEKPYTFHLGKVADVLKRFGITDEQMLAAAWLHDVVEDTKTSIEEIESNFGPRVADLVFRVTNESGKNRRERHQKTYPKIRASKDAVLLKLADRIANVEHSIESQSSFLGMYKKDHDYLVESLRTEGQADAMWNHLENLMCTQLKN